MNEQQPMAFIGSSVRSQVRASSSVGVCTANISHCHLAQRVDLTAATDLNSKLPAAGPWCVLCLDHPWHSYIALPINMLCVCVHACVRMTLVNRAFQDRCPHRLAPLSEGIIDAKTGHLLCNYHGCKPWVESMCCSHAGTCIHTYIHACIPVGSPHARHGSICSWIRSG